MQKKRATPLAKTLIYVCLIVKIKEAVAKRKCYFIPKDVPTKKCYPVPKLGPSKNKYYFQLKETTAITKFYVT